MQEFYLHVKAPFAAFRYFQAGNYRVSMPTIPHSAAYGLVLNLAGIEMRTGLDERTTTIRPSTEGYELSNESAIPILWISVGEITPSTKNTIYQQLHTYPVGNTSSHLAEGTKGAKYHILPTRCEFLIALNVIIGVRTESQGVIERIKDALDGKTTDRYGIPFAGDNNHLFDQIEYSDWPIAGAYWYYPIGADEIPESETCRLTTIIDRLQNQRTQAPVFAKTVEKSAGVPANSWVNINHPSLSD